jgi:hypothetical protein
VKSGAVTAPLDFSTITGVRIVPEPDDTKH